MKSDSKHDHTVFRRLPTSLYGVSLFLFLITAILPIAWMLGQFLTSVARDPGLLSHVLLDSRQLILLGRSLGIAVGATSVALFIGIPVAMILASRDMPLRSLFSFLMLVPLIIPPYVMAGAWIHLLSPFGTLNQAISGLLGSSATLKIQSIPGCIWCLGTSFFPLVAFIVSTGIDQLDSALQDTARLCTGRWGVFWNSTVPQLRPHLAAAVCLTLIFILAQYGVPSLLGVNTYPVEIFAQFSAFYNEISAVAICLPLITLVVLLVFAQQRIMGAREYINITPRSDSKGITSLGSMRPWAVATLLILFTITTVLPLSSIFVNAAGLQTLQVTASIFSDAIFFTALLASAAAATCTLIAFFLAHLLASSTSYAIRILNVICWIPVAIPGTVVGLGFLRATGSVSWLQQIDSFGLFLFLAYVGMFCAFSIRIFYAAYKATDSNVDEAAALDCPRWYQRCWHIDMKMHSGAIVVSLILVFVLAAGELNATVLLSPPGRDTLSVAIDNLLHYGASPTASAFCLIEAALVLAAAVGCVVAKKIAQRFSAGTTIQSNSE